MDNLTKYLLIFVIIIILFICIRYLQKNNKKIIVKKLPLKFGLTAPTGEPTVSFDEYLKDPRKANDQYDLIMKFYPVPTR